MLTAVARGDKFIPMAEREVDNKSRGHRHSHPVHPSVRYNAIRRPRPSDSPPPLSSRLISSKKFISRARGGRAGNLQSPPPPPPPPPPWRINAPHYTIPQSTLFIPIIIIIAIAIAATVSFSRTVACYRRVCSLPRPLLRVQSY